MKWRKAKGRGSSTANGTLIILAVCLVNFGESWAGRPLAIDDADPVDKGRFEVAAGSRFCGDGTPDFTATAGLTWAFGFSGNEKD